MDMGDPKVNRALTTVLLCALVLSGCYSAPKRVGNYQGTAAPISKIVTERQLQPADLGRRYAVLLSENTLATLKYFQEINASLKESSFTQLAVDGALADPKRYVTEIVSLVRGHFPNSFVATSVADARSRADFVVYIDFFCSINGWANSGACDQLIQVVNAPFSATYLRIESHATHKYPVFTFDDGENPLRGMAKAKDDVLSQSRLAFSKAFVDISKRR